MKQTRVFNGKIYNLYREYGTRTDALRDLRELKSCNSCVRMTGRGKWYYGFALYVKPDMRYKS